MSKPRTGWRGVLAALVLAAPAACGSPTQPSQTATRVDGTYTLRVDSTCAALPTDVRTRTYLAAIAGDTVTLTGATFWKHPARGLANRFGISVAGSSVSLDLETPGVDRGGIIEETTDARYFGIVGTAAGAIRNVPGGVTIEGTFSAGFGWGADLQDDNEHVGCRSGTHQATFAFTPSAAAFQPPRVANTLQRVEVVGPASVAPGATVQLEAIGHLADGSSRDVTAEVSWNKSFAFVFDLGPTGAVTGRAIGAATITASIRVPNLLGSLRDQVEMIVVPDGTVRIAGRVTGGAPAQPLVGATVVVAAGTPVGLSTTTDWEGRFALYGVAGSAEIRISKAGYTSEVRGVSGLSHETLDVQLSLVASVPNVSGVYTLTITSDQTCTDPLPDAYRVRTYRAELSQTGRLVNVFLSGVAFFVREGRGSGFSGQADPEQVTFRLTDNDHFGVGANPDFVEIIEGTRVLMAFGTITTDITPTRLGGVLQGSLVPADRALPSNGFFWGPSCTSDRHQVVFSR